MKRNNIIISKIALVFLAIVMAVNTHAQTTTEGPGNYTILKEGNGPIKIPFKMHNGKPLMELEINGKKATLMIDNGVLWNETWLFGSPLVTDLQLKPVEEVGISGSGEGDPTAAYVSSNLTMKFKDIIFYEQPSFVSPPAAGFARMFPGADGQLCNTFFKHFLVEFDFIENEVILHKPSQFKYKEEGSVLDLTPSESGSHAVPFSFTLPDGKVFTDQADIDFGGVYALKIALNNRNNIQLPANTEKATSYGAQGRSPEYKGKIERMSIGQYHFDNPTVYFGDETTARVHPDNLGMLGLPLFMKFNIIFDYINYKLYLDPNSKFDGLIEGRKD